MIVHRSHAWSLPQTERAARPFFFEQHAARRDRLIAAAQSLPALPSAKAGQCRQPVLLCRGNFAVRAVSAR